jgi:hypothetical protein
MCATQISTTQTNSNPSKKAPSHGGKQGYTPRQSGSAQKPQRSREDKRKAWAKKARPVAKPSVRVAPSKAYTSVCCSAPATKPAAGQKTAVRNPETGKTKSEPKGLGHWRCSACGKATKVTVSKAEKEAPVAQAVV